MTFEVDLMDFGKNSVFKIDYSKRLLTQFCFEITLLCFFANL